MENFTVYNPTRVHFGRDIISGFGKTVSEYGENVLLVYGKGSVKKNGIYDKVLAELLPYSLNIIEFGGIKPNPVIDDVNKAADIASVNNIDVVLAVGGGSVIDSAKIIALCTPEKPDAWDVMKGRVKPSKSLPLINILTLAATGTEMNPYSVLQNHKTHEKIGYGNELMYPAHSYLDPQFTFSVSPEYTAYGIIDLIAHAMESWFGKGEASLSDRFVAAIIKEAMYYAPLVLKEPRNYDYRANILWASTCALNGLTSYGRRSADWGVHDVGHILSYLYDMPHGATLSIAYPAWLKLQSDRIPDRIRKLGMQIFGINTVKETISRLERFFQSVDCPVRLSNTGIGKNKKEEITSLLIKNSATGFNHSLSEDDHRMIVDYMLLD